MKTLFSFLFGGLAVLFLFLGVIPSFSKGDLTGAVGFGLLCVGAVLVANGLRSQQ